MALSGCGTRSVMRMAPPPPTYAWQTSPPATAPAKTRPVAEQASAVTGAAYDVDWARLPTPHLAPKTKKPVATPTTLAAARALIGWRDPRSSLGFALAVAGGLTTAPAARCGRRVVAVVVGDSPERGPLTLV